MEMLKKQGIDWIEKNKVSLLEISNLIWENPELSMQEYYASSLLTSYLNKEGYKVQREVAGMPTAFIAEYGTEGPVIGFNCEFDALPGLSQDKDKAYACSMREGAPGHGCGHNLLSIGGIAAAGAIKSLIDAKKLKAQIKIFGTPAEELCIGKPFMAREGYFKGLDCVLDWHPMPFSKAGYNECTAYFNCKYHFKGKSAHGNAPWFGRSALDAAMLMGNALEFLREHLRPGKPDGETTLNYTFDNLGGGPNVVPDKATLWCVGRMGTSEAIKELSARVDDCARGIAIATGTTVTKELITITHEKIPNKTISQVMARNFDFVGIPQFSKEDRDLAAQIQKDAGVPIIPMGRPVVPFVQGSMPVNDSSEYSWFAPMDIAMVEMVPEGVGWHNWIVTEFAGRDAGKATVITAAKLLACTAVELIESPEIISRAKEELQERLNGRNYEVLLSADMKPGTEINAAEMKKFKGE